MCRILFVDDNQNVLSLAKDYFLSTENDVIFANHSDSAVEAVKNGVDLAIVDLDMGASGSAADVLEACRKMGTEAYVLSGNIHRFPDLLKRYKNVITHIYGKPDGLRQIRADLDNRDSHTPC